MAQVRIRESETRSSRLPKVCLACGEPSDTTVRKSFSWYPPWAGLLVIFGLFPALIAIAVLTKRMTVPVPMCERHRRYFSNRALLIMLPLIGVVIICILGMFLPYLVLEPQTADDLRPVMYVVLGLCILGVFALILLIQYTSIRARDLSDRGLLLTAVSQEFVDALEELRQERRSSADDDEEDDRPRSRRRRDDDDDDDRPRRRQRDEDDEDRPRQRRRDDDDDDRPRRRRSEPEDEADDRPRRPRDSDRDDEEEPPRRKPRRDDD
jgi:hypothetical protein